MVVVGLTVYHMSNRTWSSNDVGVGNDERYGFADGIDIGQSPGEVQKQ